MTDASPAERPRGGGITLQAECGYDQDNGHFECEPG